MQQTGPTPGSSSRSFVRPHDVRVSGKESFTLRAHNDWGGRKPAPNQDQMDAVRHDVIATRMEVDRLLMGGLGGPDLTEAYKKQALAATAAFDLADTYASTENNMKLAAKGELLAAREALQKESGLTRRATAEAATAKIAAQAAATELREQAAASALTLTEMETRNLLLEGRMEQRIQQLKTQGEELAKQLALSKEAPPPVSQPQQQGYQRPS